MTKKFFIELYNPQHQPIPQIQFATHVPRTLSIGDANDLIAELQQVIGMHNPTPAKWSVTNPAPPPAKTHEVKSEEKKQQAWT